MLNTEKKGQGLFSFVFFLTAVAADATDASSLLSRLFFYSLPFLLSNFVGLRPSVRPSARWQPNE
jgi:hypothetical protein